MERCLWRLTVGEFCDVEAQCQGAQGHEGPHEFVGWLSPGPSGGDDEEIVVSVPWSVGGERSGFAASAPPGSYDEEVLAALDPGFAAAWAEHQAQRGES